jgi:hypothetical protein
MFTAFIIRNNTEFLKTAAYTLYPHAMYSRYSRSDGYTQTCSVTAVLNKSGKDHSDIYHMASHSGGITSNCYEFGGPNDCPGAD